MSNTTKSALPLLFITLLIDMIGIGMIIPIIPIIFTDPQSHSFLLSGYSTSSQLIIAGLITALAGLMTFIASPILGELSDIYGRKKILALGVAILALSQLLFGIGIQMSSLVVLFISRALGGLAGANFSVAQASIADITEPKDRARNFGMIGAAFGIGFVVGPVLGGSISAWTNSASIPFFVAGLLGVINLLSVTFFLKETHHVSVKKQHSITFFKAVHNIKQAFNDKEAAPVYIASFLYMIGFTFFTSFSGIYLVQKFGLSEKGLGIYFGIIGIWIVITQGLILRIITKYYSERQILRYSLVCVAIAIALMPFAPTILMAYLLIPFIAIPQGLSIANLGALISKSVSKEKQGAALGINSSLSALAQGTIPAFAGGMTSITGIAAPFVIAGICMLASWKKLFSAK